MIALKVVIIANVSTSTSLVTFSSNLKFSLLRSIIFNPLNMKTPSTNKTLFDNQRKQYQREASKELQLGIGFFHSIQLMKN